MTDSSEVQVLYPARWRRRISEAQGRLRDVGSEGSVEQSRGPTDRNWIRGLPGRTTRGRSARAHGLARRCDGSPDEQREEHRTHLLIGRITRPGTQPGRGTQASLAGNAFSQATAHHPFPPNRSVPSRQVASVPLRPPAPRPLPLHSTGPRSPTHPRRTAGTWRIRSRRAPPPAIGRPPCSLGPPPPPYPIASRMTILLPTDAHTGPRRQRRRHPHEPPLRFRPGRDALPVPNPDPRPAHTIARRRMRRYGRRPRPT